MIYGVGLNDYKLQYSVYHKSLGYKIINPIKITTPIKIPTLDGDLRDLIALFLILSSTWNSERGCVCNSIHHGVMTGNNIYPRIKNSHINTVVSVRRYTNVRGER